MRNLGESLSFLKDVFICSLGAYGGPEAHYGVFTDQLVIKKGYLTEKEMIELIALTGILPGPSSTQTIVAIGHKVGGPLLALLTMLVWALPAIMIMSLLSFLNQVLEALDLTKEALRYISPMALGFILVAAYRIGKKVVIDKKTLFLFFIGTVVTYFVKTPIIYPILLLLGGLVSIVESREENIWNKVKIRPKWIYIIFFFTFLIVSLLMNLFSDNKIIKLFEMFYRYGYLVIGGGQVVVPLMYSELVEINQFVTSSEFLSGFGLVQGIPGPMFSFSAYIGGMAVRDENTFLHLTGALVSGISIFLPGLLLIYFVYPIWGELKKIKAIKISLKGITAIASGFILSSALTLMSEVSLSVENALVIAFTSLLLFTRKVPAPLIVLVVLMIGFL